MHPLCFFHTRASLECQNLPVDAYFCPHQHVHQCDWRKTKVRTKNIISVRPSVNSRNEGDLYSTNSSVVSSAAERTRKYLRPDGLVAKRKHDTQESRLACLYVTDSCRTIQLLFVISASVLQSRRTEH